MTAPNLWSGRSAAAGGMTPLSWIPSYGRGPSGEVWRLEENLYPFVELVSGVLSDDPLHRPQLLYHRTGPPPCSPISSKR